MENYYEDEELIFDENSSIEIRNICNTFVGQQKEK